MPDPNDSQDEVASIATSVSHSIRDLPPLEMGGTELRKGIGVQDHVAAKFCISMLISTDLQEVWCERQDDITLVWQTSDGEIVEFVQVKGSEMDQLWSVALLCERQKMPTSPNGVGSSILERSLANDRGREKCKFRIVTCRPVNSDLNILTYPLNSDYRTAANQAIEAFVNLVDDVSRRVGDFRSENKNDCAFWLKHTFWEVIHELDSVRHRNLLSLNKVLGDMNEFAAPDQLDDLYLRILNKAWEAAAWDWRRNPLGKRILRESFRHWFNQVAIESLHPLKSRGKLHRKMKNADLPVDTICCASLQRDAYRREVLSPKYLDVQDRSLVEEEVLATLHRLLASLDAGNLPNSGLQFHETCLSALSDLQEKLPIDPKPPLSFLQGCMYAIADRCQHRFQRYS